MFAFAAIFSLYSSLNTAVLPCFTAALRTMDPAAAAAAVSQCQHNIPHPTPKTDVRTAPAIRPAVSKLANYCLPDSTPLISRHDLTLTKSRRPAGTSPLILAPAEETRGDLDRPLRLNDPVATPVPVAVAAADAPTTATRAMPRAVG